MSQVVPSRAVSHVFLSSGDMVADRRFGYACDLQSRGDLEAAADLFLQAIELAPGFASAWFTLGEVREQQGDMSSAIDAFRRAKAADGRDFLGAGLRLMRLMGEPLAAMQAGYVASLFDQYASGFEASLVGELGYRGPALLFEAVQAVYDLRHKPPHFRRVIDLGCGTGLAARAFTGHTDEVIGIDLSPGMIRQARTTGLYRELDLADAVDGLGRRPGASADLILAADLMIYLHDLAPLMREVARVLTPGGRFAFTAETHDGDGVILGAGLRYAQSEKHLREILGRAGLVVDHIDHASIRTERELPVPSLVMVASKL